MDRDTLRGWLLAHTPHDDLERRCHTEILGVLDNPGEIFRKTHFRPGHFTSSAFVISPDQTQLLLIYHAAFGFWMQPGGHLDPTDLDLRAAALRELEEETALRDVVIPPWAPGILDVDVHAIPAGLKGQPAHRHFDVRFVFRAASLAVSAATDALAARWFDLSALEQIDTDASVRRAAARIQLRKRAWLERSETAG